MISQRSRKNTSAAYKSNRVRGDGCSPASRPCISKKMPDASQVEMPLSPARDFRSFFAAGTASRPSSTSRLSSCPDGGRLRANTHLSTARLHVCPIPDRFFVPLRPRTFARLLEQFPNHQMLIVNRSFGVDRNELENHGQCFVFLNNAADELAITLEWIIDV